MIAALAALSSAGFATILILSLWFARPGRVPYWPPPTGQSWQHRSFRTLFRLGVLPLVVASVWGMGAAGLPLWRMGVAAALIGTGFGLALRITWRMGWANAFGEPQGLVTEGWFARSRNPVYVATWIGLAGWALLVPDPLLLAPLALWAGLYVMAPRLEEPWLRQRYGQAYDAYCRRTPRFL